MRHRKRGGLLRKGEREFPDQDDRGIHENREGPVLKFAGEIAADPGIRTEQRQMPFRPAPRDIGEDGQNRELDNRRSKKEADRARAG